MPPNRYDPIRFEILTNQDHSPKVVDFTPKPIHYKSKPPTIDDFSGHLQFCYVYANDESPEGWRNDPYVSRWNCKSHWSKSWKGRLRRKIDRLSMNTTTEIQRWATQLTAEKYSPTLIEYFIKCKEPRPTKPTASPVKMEEHCSPYPSSSTSPDSDMDCDDSVSPPCPIDGFLFNRDMEESFTCFGTFLSTNFHNNNNNNNNSKSSSSFMASPFSPASASSSASSCGSSTDDFASSSCHGSVVDCGIATIGFEASTGMFTNMFFSGDAENISSSVCAELLNPWTSWDRQCPAGSVLQTEWCGLWDSTMSLMQQQQQLAAAAAAAQAAQAAAMGFGGGSSFSSSSFSSSNSASSPSEMYHDCMSVEVGSRNNTNFH